jgi:hypothetical protein
VPFKDVQAGKLSGEEYSLDQVRGARARPAASRQRWAHWWSDARHTLRHTLCHTASHARTRSSRDRHAMQATRVAAARPARTL